MERLSFVSMITDAQYFLGLFYYYQIGKDGENSHNLLISMQYMRKAAHLGHPNSQMVLGVAFLEGIGDTL